MFITYFKFLNLVFLSLFYLDLVIGIIKTKEYSYKKSVLFLSLYLVYSGKLRVNTFCFWKEPRSLMINWTQIRFLINFESFIKGTFRFRPLNDIFK